MSVALFEEYFKKRGVRRTGAGWLTYCPAHDDRNPSLSVSVGGDGRILLKCHAGCSLEQILDALGLTVRDLFPKGDARDIQCGSLRAPVVLVQDRMPDDYLDKVYRHLIGLLTLSDFHREHLLGRGMTESMIKRGLYRTLPLHRWSYIRQLLCHYDLSGVPGFGMKDGRWVMTGSPGILLPVIFNNKVVGFQIRLDQDDDGLKYKHLSSSWLDKGASSGTRVHMSVPRIISRFEVWITEGILKADIAANILGAIVWSVPGVSNWRGVVDNWQQLPWRVVIAFDRDAKKGTRKLVMRHAKELSSALGEKDIISRFAVWRNRKGIDDALVAGERVHLRDCIYK